MTETAGEAVHEEAEQLGEDSPPLYDMRVLLGSSEIQFYEVFLRRVLSLIWE